MAAKDSHRQELHYELLCFRVHAGSARSALFLHQTTGEDRLTRASSQKSWTLISVAKELYNCLKYLGSPVRGSHTVLVEHGQELALQRYQNDTSNLHLVGYKWAIGYVVDNTTNLMSGLLSLYSVEKAERGEREGCPQRQTGEQTHYLDCPHYLQNVS